ncbi:MAG: LamG domain-containing protein, partial [Planctomycetota bacterium]
EAWLGSERTSGYLMTTLVPPPAGRVVATPLRSGFVITDGQWHHIGFVWDGSRRHLYVDGAKVAEDTGPLAALQSSAGGLYIGAGKNLDAPSFFSGLIDDVRIYNLPLSAEEIRELAR